MIENISGKIVDNRIYSFPGDVISDFFHENKYEYVHYFKYFGKVVNKTFDEYFQNLTEVTLKIFQKTLINIELSN